MTRHELIAIHKVNHGPADLQGIEIPLLLQIDGQIRPGSSVKYVLLDVEFHDHPPALVADITRELKLIASRLTRIQLLSVLGLVPYCQFVQDTCLVWINNLWEPVTSRAALNLQHGDYVRIAVPPTPSCTSTSTRLAALVHHHGLGPDEYAGVRQEMPDAMHLDQMPNQLNIIDHLPFDEDWTSLLQHHSQLHRQHRLSEDFQSPIDEIIQRNERHQQERQDERILIQLAELPPTLRDLHGHILLADAQTTEDGAPHGIMTWYLSHEHAHRCNIGRPIVLEEEPRLWRTQITQTWRDQLWWDDEIAFYIVSPKPLDLEYGIVAHLLVVQHERPDTIEVALLMTLFDTAVHAGQAIRFAFISEPRIDHAALIEICDRTIVCTWPDVLCESWFGWFALLQRPPIIAHNGYGFSVSIRRQTVRDQSSQPSTVALTLDELIPPFESKVAVELLCGDVMPHVPPFIVVPAQYDKETIQHELLQWQCDCNAYPVPGHHKALCLPKDRDPTDRLVHYILVNTDPTLPDGIILHSSTSVLSEIDLMKLLHQLGYQRAAILDHYLIAELFYQVIFKNAVGSFEISDGAKSQKPWPPRQSSQYNPQPVTAQFQDLTEIDTEHLLRFDRTIEDLCQLLQSGHSLCTDWEQLDLPDNVIEAITACEPWDPTQNLDRLVIYTDGSSSASRHSIPERCDGPDQKVDTWAFVVIGEQYQTGRIFFLGWQAQPVLYGLDKEQYLGASRIGSEVTECEALFWAMLWRIGRNSYIPTLFRPDNSTVIGQAQGTFGAQQRGIAFDSLRGAFQLLEHMLPEGDLMLAHVRGHCADPWNDFADHAAKQESKRSHYISLDSHVTSEPGHGTCHIFGLCLPGKKDYRLYQLKAIAPSHRVCLRLHLRAACPVFDLPLPSL